MIMGDIFKNKLTHKTTPFTPTKSCIVLYWPICLSTRTDMSRHIQFRGNQTRGKFATKRKLIILATKQVVGNTKFLPQFIILGTYPKNKLLIRNLFFLTSL